jgi:hypothetical protein
MTPWNAVEIERSTSSHDQQSQLGSTPGDVSVQSMLDAQSGSASLDRRKLFGFEVQDEPISDFISKGLITPEQAMSSFRT